VLVRSRRHVEECSNSLDDVIAVSGQVNAKHGTSDWEPVRLLVGETYSRAIAAMQLHDVLLVNPIADEMNLVAKEGPVESTRDGVLLLSEGAAAHEQLYEV
jgi:trehalose 6-phosphate synthase